jgi:lysophospholipase L1-like esterase
LGVLTVLAAIVTVPGCHWTSGAGGASPTATTPAAATAPASSAPGSSAPGSSASGAAASPATVSGPVVALGDSYTAGALLPLQPLATPSGCLRSAKAYPVLVAAGLGAPLTDVACASAGVKNLSQPQRTYLGTNPAQLAALSPADSVVLLTLGGDDIGFLNVLQECAKLSFTNPWGSPCKAHYTQGGTDQLAANVRAEAPRIAAALTAIRTRAPHARVVLVGYPDMFPQTGGCWPRVPVTSGDIGYLRGIELTANAMLAADATQAGAIFVNTYQATAGHDFCRDESARDIEGLVPGSLALPFHPNARGQAAIAAAVLSALRE